MISTIAYLEMEIQEKITGIHLPQYGFSAHPQLQLITGQRLSHGWESGNWWVKDQHV